MLPILFYASMIFTVAGFFSTEGWWMDLSSHFRVQYFFVQLVCLIFFMLGRKWSFVTLAAFFALLNAKEIYPLYTSCVFRQLSLQPTLGKIEILLINGDVQENDYKNVFQYIYANPPDILAVKELNQEGLIGLSSVLNQYGYRYFVDREDGFGLGVFSNLPLEDAVIRSYGRSRVPGLVAQFSTGMESFTLVLIHLWPPVTRELFHWRNEQLDQIALHKDDFPKNLIMLGDFNMTSWTEYFPNFLQKMNLVDSRLGFGIQPTWPSAVATLGIPIDHCLVSQNFRVLERRIGPHLGSDHRPVFLKLELMQE